MKRILLAVTGLSPQILTKRCTPSPSSRHQPGYQTKSTCLGVLSILDWADRQAPEPPPHEALTAIGFLPPAAIASDPRFELWSRLAAEFIASQSTTIPSGDMLAP
jgi:hypothetical protein